MCGGGSVTDLVHGLKRNNRRLTEEQIAYILRETVEVILNLKAIDYTLLYMYYYLLGRVWYTFIETTVCIETSKATIFF